MKIKEFDVPIFESNVCLIEITSKRDASSKDLAHKLFELDFRSEDIIEIQGNIEEGLYNSGTIYHNNGNDKYTILLYVHNSKEARTNTMCHEKRHLEDFILKKKNIDDKETAGYLAGYLAEKML